MTFKAYNFDPAVKAQAEAKAQELTRATGRRYRVEYRDSYSDSMVMGYYVVMPA